MGEVALSHLSLDLLPNERVAIVGERAAGVTTLARWLALVERPPVGKVYLEGQDITRAWGGRLRQVRGQLQYVGGDPLRILPPNATVSATLLEPLQIHRRGSAAEQQAQVESLAAQWHLNSLLLQRKISALSAALRQRVALARALSLSPQVLVTDEVIERLEAGAKVPLLVTLSQICQQQTITWLWTTTDLALARRFADRVLLLAEGQLRTL
jgi:ABC-type glutathione transport system ATPase component